MVTESSMLTPAVPVVTMVVESCTLVKAPMVTGPKSPAQEQEQEEEQQQ